MEPRECRKWKVRLVFREGASGTVELPAGFSARDVWHLIRNVYPTCAVYVLQRGTRCRRATHAAG